MCYLLKTSKNWNMLLAFSLAYTFVGQNMPHSEKSAKVSSDHAYLKILLSSIFPCSLISPKDISFLDFICFCVKPALEAWGPSSCNPEGRDDLWSWPQAERWPAARQVAGSLTQDSGLTNGTFWLVVSTPLKKSERHLGSLFPIYGKMKNVPNHQPAFKTSLFGAMCFSPMCRIVQLPKKEDVHL